MPEGEGMHVLSLWKKQSRWVRISHCQLNIFHWLDKYEGKYAKKSMLLQTFSQTFDEGCDADPDQRCIAVGDMADYIVETNKGGHYVTKERFWKY